MKTKVKLSQKSAEELADMKIKLGFNKPEERNMLIEYASEEFEVNVR